MQQNIYAATHRPNTHTQTHSYVTVIAGCRAQQLVEDSIDVVKESFDNNLTPYYALVIAIWGSSVSIALGLVLHGRRPLNQQIVGSNHVHVK